MRKVKEYVWQLRKGATESEKSKAKAQTSPRRSAPSRRYGRITDLAIASSEWLPSSRVYMDEHSVLLEARSGGAFVGVSTGVLPLLIFLCGVIAITDVRDKRTPTMSSGRPCGVALCGRLVALPLQVF